MLKIGTDNLKQRSVYRDLLRIISALAVVCIHVCSNSGMNEYSSQWNALNVYDTLSRFSVPVFFMISGSFLLDLNRPQPLSKIYKNKIPRMAIAYIFWFVVYTLWRTTVKIKSGELTIESVLSSPIKFIDNAITENFHMWFIFAIIFLYAATPIVRKLCEDIKTERYFIILSCIPLFYNLLTIFISPPSLQYVFENLSMNLVMGYTVYFVVGHYAATYDINKKRRIIIYILAAVSLVFTAVYAWHLKITDRSTETVYKYLLPNIFFPSLAIFLLFKYGFSKVQFSDRAIKIISGVSSLTFGIYLSHMLVVYALNLLNINVLSFNTVISAPVLTIAIFIISMGITFVLKKIPFVNKYIV
ncbi:MAG: acyltransferase family protein [Clostridia bacterium]|nr:acyltransferase family protein [Clostridia bacterium]